MSNPTPPAGPGTESVLRFLTAGTLLALGGLVILFGLTTWVFLVASVDSLPRFSPDPFTSVTVLVAPLLAVLVATRMSPVLPMAKLFGVVALLEYAAAFVFGTLGLLLSMVDRLAQISDGLHPFADTVQYAGFVMVSLVELGLLVLAMLWTYHLFRHAGGRLRGAALT